MRGGRAALRHFVVTWRSSLTTRTFLRPVVMRMLRRPLLLRPEQRDHGSDQLHEPQHGVQAAVSQLPGCARAWPPAWAVTPPQVAPRDCCKLTPVALSDCAASFTNLAYLGGHIDNPANMASSKVFVYSGLLDSVVHRSVVEDAVSYYNLFVNASSGGVVTTEYDILSGTDPAT